MFDANSQSTNFIFKIAISRKLFVNVFLCSMEFVENDTCSSSFSSLKINLIRDVVLVHSLMIILQYNGSHCTVCTGLSTNVYN